MRISGPQIMKLSRCPTSTKFPRPELQLPGEQAKESVLSWPGVRWIQISKDLRANAKYRVDAAQPEVIGTIHGFNARRCSRPVRIQEIREYTVSPTMFSKRRRRTRNELRGAQAQSGTGAIFCNNTGARRRSESLSSTSA